MSGRALVTTGERLLPFAVVVAAWDLVVRMGPLPPQLCPGPGAVGRALWRLIASGVLLAHVHGTIVRLIAGFLLAAVLGVLVGVAMGRSAVAAEVWGRWSASAAPSRGSPTPRFSCCGSASGIWPPCSWSPWRPRSRSR